MNEVKIISSNETKKIKKKTNLNYLWDQFDNEFISPKSTLECIYRQEGEREICDYCKKQLEISNKSNILRFWDLPGLLARCAKDRSRWAPNLKIAKNLQISNII